MANMPMPPQYVLPPERRTGMATTSLVLGLLSIPLLCACVGVPIGLIAMILGIIAAARAASRPEAYGGMVRAIVGIVCGGMTSVVLFVVGLVMWATGLAAAVVGGSAFQSIPIVQSITQGITAAFNVERIAKGLSAYEAEFGVVAPSVEALVASGLIPDGPWGKDPNDNPIAAAAWLPGVSERDPGDWIIAYTSVSFLGQPQYLVYTVRGEIEHYDRNGFDARLRQFMQVYKTARGKSPEFVGALADLAPTELSP